MASEHVRTLVFGDDGSPAADIAWLLINNHSWPGWQLEIITARPSAIGPPASPERTVLHRWDPPQPRPVSTEARFAHVVYLTAVTDPRLALLRHCDLLVIGPRGPGLLKALHVGSTADWLLVHPPAPLLIARHGHTIRSVVLCSDGSPHANRVTAALAHLPWVRQLDITVLVIDDSRTDVDDAIRAARVLLEPCGANVDMRVEIGKPSAMIHGHIDQTSPHLVALGTSGLSGLRHLSVCSTASAIARTSPCSVLVACDDEHVRPFAADR